LGSMDEARQAPSGGGSEQRSGLAQKLRRAREAKGASIDEAHRATGVPLHYLKMFEVGHFPMVSDPAYLAPFLRRYAAHLGLDPERALRDLIAENEPETATRRSGKQAQAPEGRFRPVASAPAAAPASRTGGRPVRDHSSRWIVYAAGLLLAALVGVGGYMTLARDGQGRAVQRLAKLETTSTAPAAATRSIPAATKAPKVDAVPYQPPSPSAPQVAERHATTAPASQDAPLPPPTSAPSPPASQPGAQSPSPPYELLLTATSRPVWIWVSIDDGPRRSLLLDPGRSVKWSAQQGYLLSVDDAGAVRAVLNGTPLGALGGESQARRNVMIPSPEVRSARAIDDGG
jgi:cytoskeleton protein RodZ